MEKSNLKFSPSLKRLSLTFGMKLAVNFGHTVFQSGYNAKSLGIPHSAISFSLVHSLRAGSKSRCDTAAIFLAASVVDSFYADKFNSYTVESAGFLFCGKMFREFFFNSAAG